MITTPSNYIKRLEAIQRSVNSTIEMVNLGTEPLFIINTDTREITVPPAMHQLGVVSDHNAETIYLQIDRYFDDADLSQKTCVIQYINAADEKRLYPITEKYIDDAKGKLTFAWKLSGNVTKAAGIISFSVRFYEIENDAYLYNFNTKTASFLISDGLDIREDLSIAPSPTDIIILVEHLDQVAVQTANDVNQTSEDRMNVESLVDSVVQTIADKRKDAVKEINTTTSNQIEKIGTEGTAQINKIQQKGYDTLESIPNDYTQLSNGVSDLKHKDIRSSSMFSNALIGEVTDEGQVVINDAANAAIPYLEIDGASEQVVTTGAQLFDMCKATVTNGATVKSNGNKITLSGINAYAALERSIPIGVVANKTLTLSGKIISQTNQPGKAAIQAALTLADNTIQYNNVASAGEKVTFNVLADVKGVNVRLISNNTSTALDTPNTVVFADVMLNIGTTALPWEPYTGGKPSPSPEYPQEIVSVAHLANSGAQLFDASKITIGKYISPGTGAISSGSDEYCVSGKIYLAQGDYVLNGNTGNGYNVGVYQNDTFKRAIGIEVANTPTAISVKDGENCVILTAQTKDAPNIMLNAGSTPIPWEPYNGQQREIDLEIESGGANLFDIDNATFSTNTIPDNGFIKTNNGVKFTISSNANFGGLYNSDIPKENGFYNMSCDIILSSKEFNWIKIGFEGHLTKQVVPGDFTGNKAHFQISGETSNQKALVLYVDNMGKTPGVTVEFANIMIAKGDTALPWEPYTGYQKVTIPLTEPLRGIGEGKDRICMRDGVWGIERQYAKIILNGSENEKWTTNSSWENLLFSMVLSNSKKYDGYSTVADILCDKLEVDVPQVLAATIGKSGIALGSSPNKVNSEVFIAVADHVDTKNIERFRSWLAENPIEMVYPLAESTWEPFPAEIQATLNAPTTHPGTTYLTVTSTDVSAPMRLEYVQDINKVITQLYTTINELKQL